MRLIKLSSKGFKSFANEINMKFDGGVVGIVGPNGAGKSNISDAIKWVLGETSAKSLRGNSMEDVIFSGSKSVQAMDKAYVSLTFDNSEKTFENFGSKIKITRVIERKSRTSKYFINDELATLKEIKNIAMETGISKTSLAIISQGTISNIAEDDPVKRRAVFDEAAGVLLYKKRKEEAIRKLDKTNESFQQIAIVQGELKRQITPLQKQAEKAKLFLEKQALLKDVEISLIVEDIKFFRKKLTSVEKEINDFDVQKENFETEITSYGSKLEEIFNKRDLLEKDISELLDKQQKISEKIRVVELEDLQKSQRRKMVLDGTLKTNTKEQEEVLKEEYSSLQSKTNFYLENEEKLEKEIEKINNENNNNQGAKNKLQIELNNLKSQKLRKVSRFQILEDYNKNKTHLFKGTKTVLDNAKLFNGVIGLVSDLFEVEEKYQVAIDTILKKALQNIVVKESQVAVEAINFLKNNNGGQATFIPLSSIKPKNIFEDHLSGISHLEGFVNIALELVSYEKKYETLFRFLLGNILIATNIDKANQIARTLNYKYMVVSLDGNIIRPGGIISGGKKDIKSNLNLQKQIENIKNEIPYLEEQIQNIENQITQIENNLVEKENKISQFKIEKTRFNEKRSNLDFRLSEIKLKLSESNIDLPQGENNDLDSKNLSDLEFERSSIVSIVNSKRETVLKLNKQVSTISNSKSDLEKELREITEKFSNILSDQKQANYIIENASERLSQGYNLTFEKAKEVAKPISNLEESREVVEKIHQEIKDLGYVNVESIEAFEKLNERFEKINTTYEELLQAQQTILSAIKEMDQIIVNRLEKTVNDVNEQMDSIFKSMFGGGFAKVQFSDVNNILESGVEVIAQPPGKTVKNLRLFSGGEKSLVAISLLFAILKSKPLPLCVLDEVEAALDEANVVRYVNFLQELKSKTQFLVTTHRIGTMARVDHLFGVTMQNKGVTSVFSIAMEKAKELINN